MAVIENWINTLFFWRLNSGCIWKTTDFYTPIIWTGSSCWNHSTLLLQWKSSQRQYINECSTLSHFWWFLKIYILLIMLLQLSHFLLPFIPLCPVPHSHQNCLPLSSCPWVIHISSLASTFPILFVTFSSLWKTPSRSVPRSHRWNEATNTRSAWGEKAG